MWTCSTRWSRVERHKSYWSWPCFSPFRRSWHPTAEKASGLCTTATAREPVNRWAMGLYLPEQWLELREELERVRPPYIFVFPDYAELMPQRSPETMRFIEQNYRVLRTSDLGTWYIRNEIQVRP